MKISFLLFFFFCSAGIFAQAPAIQWQKCLGGDGLDDGYSIQQTSDGGYIVAGNSNSNDSEVSGNHGSTDYWVVKLNGTGAIEWQKSLGGSNEDVAFSILQTSDGGYIVAGYSWSDDSEVSGNHGEFDYWVVKLSDTGAIQWQKSLGGSNLEEANSICQTLDGGYIVAGSSESNDSEVSGNHGNFDYWVVKLNDTGAIQWQKSLGGSSPDNATSIQQTSDGGYIVAGSTGSNDGNVTGNHGSGDYWVVKLSDTGTIQWQKTLGGSNLEAANSIHQTLDGGYIVAGYSYSNDGEVSGNHGSEDYWIVKLNDTGAIQWQKSLGGSNDDNANSIHQTLDGGYIVAGYSMSNNGDVSGNHGSYDYWIVKLNDTGAVQWQKSLGGSSYDCAEDIQQTVDGGYIVAGYTASNDSEVSENHGYEDYWIVKLTCGINAGAISGTLSLCAGTTLTLTDTIPGGTWSSGTLGIATIGSTGLVTGVAVGIVAISYTVTNSCGSAVALQMVTVNTFPEAGTITGSTSICTDSSVTLIDAATGGTWSVSNGNATASGNIITGVTVGADTAVYTVTNTCGTATTTYPFSITLCPTEVKQLPVTTPITIIPNPTTGYISITGISNINIKIYNTIGQLIKEASNTDNISISTFPAGLYFVRVFDERGALVKADKIVKE